MDPVPGTESRRETAVGGSAGLAAYSSSWTAIVGLPANAAATVTVGSKHVCPARSEPST